MTVLVKPCQQAVKQGNVAARFDWQVQIGDVAACGFARIDHDDFGAVLFPGCAQTLVQDRMAPCQVRSGQNDQIGNFQVFVTSRYNIGTKGTFMPDHG